MAACCERLQRCSVASGEADPAVAPGAPEVAYRTGGIIRNRPSCSRPPPVLTVLGMFCVVHVVHQLTVVCHWGGPVLVCVRVYRQRAAIVRFNVRRTLA